MKKLILLLIFVLSVNTVFAFDVQKNEEYYKSQIQNQRILYNTTGLVGAIQKDNPQVVDYFMKAGFNPNATYMGIPVTFFAVKVGDMKSLESLLKHGANPNATSPDTNLLLWAIHYKSSESVNLLIKYGVDVNSGFRYTLPLNKAISSKQTKIVETLLKAGAIPNNKTWKMVDKSKDEYLKELFAGIER